MSTPRYWLIKSEPDAFSFDDLLATPERTTSWDGVRNYQARNFMRDGRRVGDELLFYHSSTKSPTVVGIARVVREAYLDPSQFDPADRHYDPKASQDNPRWVMVDIQAVRRLPRAVTLDEIKAAPELTSMKLAQRGNRLSVMPVTEKEFCKILTMSEDVS